MSLRSVCTTWRIMWRNSGTCRMSSTLYCLTTLPLRRKQSPGCATWKPVLKSRTGMRSGKQIQTWVSLALWGWYEVTEKDLFEQQHCPVVHCLIVLHLWIIYFCFRINYTSTNINDTFYNVNKVLINTILYITKRHPPRFSVFSMFFNVLKCFKM